MLAPQSLSPHPPATHTLLKLRKEPPQRLEGQVSGACSLSRASLPFPTVLQLCTHSGVHLECPGGCSVCSGPSAHLPLDQDLQPPYSRVCSIATFAQAHCHQSSHTEPTPPACAPEAAGLLACARKAGRRAGKTINETTGICELVPSPQLWGSAVMGGFTVRKAGKPPSWPLFPQDPGPPTGQTPKCSGLMDSRGQTAQLPKPDLVTQKALRSSSLREAPGQPQASAAPRLQPAGVAKVD